MAPPRISPSTARLIAPHEPARVAEHGLTFLQVHRQPMPSPNAVIVAFAIVPLVSVIASMASLVLPAIATGAPMIAQGMACV